MVYTHFIAASVNYDDSCDTIQPARTREMTTVTRTALLIAANPRWNDDLYPVLQEMGFDVVSLGSFTDLRDALRAERFELLVLCSPFKNMTPVNSLDIAKSLAPESRVIVLTEDMTERDLRDALISGSFAAVNRPLGYQDLSALLLSADEGLLVHVR